MICAKAFPERIDAGISRLLVFFWVYLVPVTRWPVYPQVKNLKRGFPFIRCPVWVSGSHLDESAIGSASKLYIIYI